MTYTLTASSSIVRDSDGATIPADPSNRDYADFLAWKDAGGAPTALARPPAPDLVDEFVAAATALLEEVATGMTYTNSATLIGWQGSAIPQYAAEAAAFLAWRDAVWIVLNKIDRDKPPASVEDALALLPTFKRPVLTP